MIRSIFMIAVLISGVANAKAPEFKYETASIRFSPSMLVEHFLHLYKKPNPEQIQAEMPAWGEIPESFKESAFQFVTGINSANPYTTPLEFEYEQRLVVLIRLFLEYFFYQPLGISASNLSSVRCPLSALYPLNSSYAYVVVDPRVVLEHVDSNGASTFKRIDPIQIAIGQTRELFKVIHLLKDFEKTSEKAPVSVQLESREMKTYDVQILLDKWTLLSFFAKNLTTPEHQAAFVEMANRIPRPGVKVPRLCAQLEKLQELPPNDFLDFIKSLSDQQSEPLTPESLLESLSHFEKSKLKSQPVFGFKSLFGF